MLSIPRNEGAKRRPISRRKTQALFLFLLAGVLGCGRLPSNFESLPLDQQVVAYAHHLRATRGIPLSNAQSAISWHGWLAADLMVKCIDGTRSDLPPIEAIEIITLVQRRGCSLKGTAAESAVARFLRQAPNGSLDHQAAQFAADVISEDNIDEHIDHFTTGPCSEALKKRVKH